MDYRKLSDADLADFAKNVAARLAAHDVECLDADLSDSFAAAIAPISAAFEDDIEESIELTARKESVNARKSDRRTHLLKELSNVLHRLEATKGTERDYDLCGFKYRKAWSHVVAKDPTDLSVTGTLNGGNKVKFKGNNRRSSVTFEIWRRDDGASEWDLIVATTKQSFADKLATPGAYYEYKIRAVAARNKSNFSNVGVVGRAA